MRIREAAYGKHQEEPCTAGRVGPGSSDAREKAIKKRRVTSRAPKVRERRGSHGQIGKRVFVVWNTWEPYTGTVTKHDPFKSHSLFVEYDDGEKQWEAAEDVRPIDEFIVLE